MERRRFLITLAAGLAGAAVGRGTIGGADPRTAPVAQPLAAPAAPAAAAVEVPLQAGPLLPPTGVVQALPGKGTSLALTIDDGTNTEVVSAFIEFAADSGTRLTFFPNGVYRSWEENADALRPLIESGQVAIGNHTWSHPDLTTLDDRAVAEEISRNRDFMRSVLGVRDSPFFRPPFGARDERTDRISADEGHPTVVMWDGTLEDHRVLTPAELMDAARKWFAAQRIIVGHANHATVTTVYGELLDLIAELDLTTVTLADVWATPAQALRGRRAGGSAAVV
jgi:peptidoglycan/xylan/chitin deacetylase (PgdA/CDA1 family)